MGIKFNIRKVPRTLSGTWQALPLLSLLLLALLLL